MTRAQFNMYKMLERTKNELAYFTPSQKFSTYAENTVGNSLVQELEILKQKYLDIIAEEQEKI